MHTYTNQAFCANDKNKNKQIPWEKPMLMVCVCVGKNKSLRIASVATQKKR